MNIVKNFFGKTTYILTNNFKTIISLLITYLSFSYALYGFLKNGLTEIFPNLILPRWFVAITSNFNLYIASVIIYIFISEIYKSKFEIKIDNEHSIIISVDDFMNNVETFKKSHCVFGTNDSFNCDINKLVHTSIHYQFMCKYFKDSFDEHQEEINLSLKKYYTPCDGFYDDIVNRHYISGTIATIKFDSSIDSITNTNESRYAFMIANSRLKGNDKSYKMINSNINYPQELWNYIDAHSIISDSIIFPLIGTSSCTGQVSKNEVALQIIDAFFDNIHKGDIKELIISIPIEDYAKRKIDVIMLRNYIKSKSYNYNQKLLYAKTTTI